MLPDHVHGGELRSIVRDDEVGTVSGDHCGVVDGDFRNILDRSKPMDVGGPRGYRKLLDPAHDPAGFLIIFYPFNDRILDEPLRSTLSPVFDGKCCALLLKGS